ncbi:MAG TPA: hypothetical protein VE360_06575 [Pyrinomonadaceae bacterium]|jgi:hypothetical protein|nr:hypothetical protein [Pyrinomonadaceae bacterium]
MSEVLIVLSSDDDEAGREARRELQSGGGRVTQNYGREVLIAEADAKLASALEAHPGVVGVYEDAVPADATRGLDETAKMGVAAWNERRKPSFREAKRQRKGEGLSWGHPDFEREG